MRQKSLVLAGNPRYNHKCYKPNRNPKSIAVLGVVAGLGVAALPLATYAAPTEIEGSGDPLSASKNVQLQLEVKETLSMFVTNEDGDADVTAPVVLSSTDNANFAASPIAIKVNAGNQSGYYLTIAGSTDGDDATVLKNSSDGIIEAGDLTSTTVSQWGYKVLKGAEGATLDTAWNAVKAGGATETIDSLDKAGVQTTQVTFGAHIVDGQEAGVYNGQVTFTATAGAEA